MTSWAGRPLGVLELTALPSIGEERWVPWVREADVLLVDGGDAAYLNHRIRQSGLAEVISSLPETVWVGLSAEGQPFGPGWKTRTSWAQRQAAAIFAAH